jgi:hypothetical protein
MIPLVDHEADLEILRELVVSVGQRAALEIGADYRLGW